MRLTIETATWEPEDAKILQSIIDIFSQPAEDLLGKKRDIAVRSDAPTSNVIVTQNVNRKQDENVLKTHHAHHGRKRFSESSTITPDEEKELIDLLSVYDLQLSYANSPSVHRIGAKKTIEDQYHKMGFDEMNVFLKAITPIWKEFDGERWDASIINEVCSFVHTYYPYNIIDADNLSSHLTGHLKGVSNVYITPKDFIKAIKEQGLKEGELTRKLYEHGFSRDRRLRES